MGKKRRGLTVVCYAVPLTARNLQWIFTVSLAVLMLTKGTAIQKSFLVPLFALQAPVNIISWIKGTQQGAIISLLIAGYLASQHFSRAGSFQKAFDQGSVVATLAIICIIVVSCFFLI
ncbi:cold-regulated 413 inner membrane protein 2, chloroplastic-like [Mangifera indica]|uniref:cold-regulated 413 inner membrane protein 2, chloroplastic-like n=1 Tax=Mangifera indica TaxID=29780 RepID=UPI001CFA1FE2|nr:cold-regulated 413 inner membrane protein 2, chloroplastic-like [Mangifera indica]